MEEGGPVKVHSLHYYYLMSSSAASTSAAAAAAAKGNESSTKKTSSTNNTKSTSTNKNSSGLFNFFKKKSDIYQSKIDHVANGKTWRDDPIEKARRVWECMVEGKEMGCFSSSLYLGSSSCRACTVVKCIL